MANKLTFDTIKTKIFEKWNDQFTILEDDRFVYQNVHQHIKIKCNKCNEVYDKRINDLLHGYGCRKCSGKTVRTNSELKKYILDITNNEYSLISDASKTRDIGIFTHNIDSCLSDNHTFSMKIHNFITLDHRCPFCNKGSKGLVESNGNKRIQKYLKEHNITFVTEYCFSDLKNNTRFLPFDFWLPDLKILIEYDGIQHYKSMEYFGGSERFNRCQENDKLKNEYAISHNLQLFRIPYTDFSRIYSILDGMFNDHRTDYLISKNLVE